MSEFKGHYQITLGSNRSFGVVFACVFLIISLYPILNGNIPIIWAAVVAGVFLLVGLFVPRILSPLNFIWFKFGILLGIMITPIVMTIIFFLAVVPTALFVRVIGKDLLRLKFDSDAKTYWIVRDESNAPMGSMKNQF